MYSKLPARIGDTPTKVVFEGVEPGSAEAQRLFHEHQGAIGHFHQKARQQNELSGSPGAHMQQAMPGGGQFRYSFNQGQETIHVRLEPPPGVTSSEEVKPEKYPTNPALAIDVLFEADPYFAGDIYGSSAPPGYGEPGYFTEERMLAQTNVFYGPNNYLTNLRRNPIYQNPQVTLIRYGFWSVYTRGDEDPALDPYFYPDMPYLSVPKAGGTGDNSDYYPPAPPVTIPPGGLAVWTRYMVVRVQFVVPAGASGTGSDLNVDYLDTVVVGHSIAESISSARATYEYLDVVNTVGVIGNINEKKPEQEYGALSPILGGVLKFDDDRLKPLFSEPEDGSPKDIDRELVFLDPSHMGFTGAGFIAVPATPPSPTGGGNAPITFDVYLASENLSKYNEPPGSSDVTWEADDPSFSYKLGDVVSGQPLVEWKIRVREFTGAPAVIKVETTTEKRLRSFTTGATGGGGGSETEGGGGLPGGPPGGSNDPTPGGPGDVDDYHFESETIQKADERTVTWFFAGDKDWTDKGGEPADPTNEKPAEGDKPPKPLMGSLLAEAEGSTRPVGPQPIPRRVLHKSEWAKDVEPSEEPPPKIKAEVEKMTKIARITWTPPTEQGQPGKAEIEIA